MRRKLNFLDLDGDCQWMIIKEMDMDDLPAMAEAHQYIAYAVADVLRRKFATKTIIIGQRGYYHNFGSQVNMEEFDDRIELRRHSSVPKILANFGHIITKIRVLHEFSTPKDIARDIYAAINLYCSDTLTELHILNENDIFVEFKKPFKSVEHVSLGGSFDELNNLTLVELFPSMRSLILNQFYCRDAHILDHHFPHLVAVTDEKKHWGHWGDSKFQQYDSLIRLIKLNPQIRNLTTRCAVPKLLQIANDELQQLVHLGLSFYNDIEMEEYTINFENLKSIWVKASTLLQASRFTFPKVEAIEFDDRSIFEGFDWIDIIGNTPSLRRIQINTDYTLDAWKTSKIKEHGFKASEIHFQDDNDNDIFVLNLDDLSANNQITLPLTTNLKPFLYVFERV